MNGQSLSLPPPQPSPLKGEGAEARKGREVSSTEWVERRDFFSR